jgi:predicted Fe-Mo cluster-binding NifX family protein
VAISSQGDNVSSQVDARFGRAPWFIIIDTERDGFQAVENNQNLNAPQGAGIQSAQTVANHGVNAVLTGHCGPKAFSVLARVGIKVYAGVEGTVSDAVEQFNAGALQESDGADVEGHW